MKTVAIAGGIGSGKSVVSQLLRVMGYPVYDCDSRAKVLMDTDAVLKNRLMETFGSAAVVDGIINRPYIAEVVFKETRMLNLLNSIVHPAVVADFEQWAARQASGLVFVETAILQESGLDAVVDVVWEVTADEHCRIRRVMARNGLSEQVVRSRMASQRGIKELALPIERIDNNGQQSVLAQVSKLVKEYDSAAV
mgnify:CR=1 FL=1